MSTQYTPILQLALPVTGELNGTWGDVVNDNITSMVEEAIAGLATISTWTANVHTLTTANGTTDEARCAMLVLQTGSGGTALSAAGQVVCPALSKLYVVKNDAAYAVTVKTSGGSGVAVAAGDTAFVFCDGTNVNACVTQIVNGHITGNLTVDGTTTLNDTATTETILPATDNTYDLGSVSNSWRNLYIEGTATIATLNVTTIDTTNLEVTNIKAKDGTASITLADSTGVATLLANPVLNAGTANGVLYLNASKAATSGSGLTFTGSALGIATTSPAAALDVNSANMLIGTKTATSGSGGNIGYRDDTGATRWYAGILNTAGATNFTIYDQVGGASRLNITSSGNVAINATPSAWIGTALQIGSTVNPVLAAIGYNASGNTFFCNSAYNYTGSAWKYAVTGYTSELYLMGSGTHVWYTAPSGTAGDVVTYTEAMRIRSDSNIGIGTTGYATANVALQSKITGGATAFGFYANGTVQSDVTSANNYYSNANTQATAFTLNIYRHYYAGQGTIGAGSSITNQYGFFVGSDFTAATNNYGFYGNITAATGRWNLYLDGTASNYMEGSLGIGTTGVTGYAARIAKSVTGATSGFGLRVSPTAASDVTGALYGIYSDPNTSAAVFNVGSIYNFRAVGQTYGTGSTATYHIGYQADSTLGNAATNTYGFRGLLASGSNKYNLFMDGTANNYLAGSLGINTTTIEAKLAVVQSAADTRAIVLPCYGSPIAENYTSVLGKYAAGNDFCQSEVRFGIQNISSGTGFLAFATGTNSTTERMRIDGSGFIGIATTPSAWSTTARPIEWYYGAIAQGVNGEMNIISNAYEYSSAAFKYKASSLGASRYASSFGTHSWYVAPSGTAGSVATFSIVMNLNSAGLAVFPTALTVGDSTSTSDVSIDLGASRTGNGNAYVDFHSQAGTDYDLRVIREPGANGSSSVIHNGTGSLRFTTVNAAPMLFYTSNTERMRIDSSGNVGIGATPSGTYKFEVSGLSSFAGNMQLSTGYFRTVDGGSASIPSIQPGNDVNTGMFWVSADTLAFSTGGTERCRLDSTGSFMVGPIYSSIATNAFGMFYQQGDSNLVLSKANSIATTTWYTTFNYGGATAGRIEGVTATTIAYTTSSDYRLKKDVQPMQGGLAKVMQLNPVTYTWTTDEATGQGFIAHELQAIVPDCVTGKKDDVDENGNPKYQGVDLSFLVATLTNAIQELKAELDAVKAEVAALKGA